MLSGSSVLCVFRTGSFQNLSKAFSCTSGHTLACKVSSSCLLYRLLDSLPRVPLALMSDSCAVSSSSNSSPISSFCSLVRLPNCSALDSMSFGSGASDSGIIASNLSSQSLAGSINAIHDVSLINFSTDTTLASSIYGVISTMADLNLSMVIFILFSVVLVLMLSSSSSSTWSRSWACLLASSGFTVLWRAISSSSSVTMVFFC